MGPLGRDACEGGMSGTTGTVRTIADLLQLVRDDQPAGSVTPQTIRDMIASLQAISGVTEVAGRDGIVTLVAADLADFATATLQAIAIATAPQYTSLASTDTILARSGSAAGWTSVGALQKLFGLTGSTTPATLESAEGTAVTTIGPAITDSFGNTYSISGVGQIVINGTADTTTSDVVELYYHAPTPGAAKQVYWENRVDIWRTRANGSTIWVQTTTPLPQPAAPPTTPAAFTSGNGAGITGLTSSATTLNSVTLTWTPPLGAASSLQYVAQFKRWCDFTWTYVGVPFTGATCTVSGLAANTWYQFRVQPNGGRFSQAYFLGTPAPSATVASPDGYIVSDFSTKTPPEFSFTDASGNRWSLTRGDDVSPYYVVRNGATDTTTANVTGLVLSGGNVYQTNKDQLWWYWSGSSWTATTDPRAGAPPVGVLPPTYQSDASADDVMGWHGAQPLNGMAATIIYAGPDWLLSSHNPTQDALSSALRTMVSGPYLSGLSEYGVFTPPQIVNEIVVTTTPPSSPVETDHQNFLASLFNAGTLAPPSSDAHIFFIHYQNGVSVPNALGEHNSFFYNGNMVRYGYCVGYQLPAPQTMLDERTSVTAHEFAEAATDPTVVRQDGTLGGFGWSGWGGPTANSANSVIEIEDFNTITLPGAYVNGVWVAGFYSNRIGAYIIPTSAPSSLPSWPPAPPAIPTSTSAPGPGPAATGTMASVDFTATTGVFASGCLWGFGTAALADSTDGGATYFQPCTIALNVTALAALNMRLLRINCNAGTAPGSAVAPNWTAGIFANGVNNPDFSKIQNFMNVAYKFISPTCRLIIGVQFYPNIGNPSDYATACKAIVNYFKTTPSGGQILPLWGIEIDNETDGKVDTGTFCSFASAAADAVHSIDPNIQIIAPVYSYVAATAPDGRFTTLGNVLGTRLGRLGYHGYRYGMGVDATPTDDGLFATTKPAADATVARASVAGTPAANAPIMMGEWNIDFNAGNETREQQQIGAVFAAFWILNGFLSGKGVECAAIWEALGDGTYGAVQNGVIDPTGYFLSKAGQVMEGNQVSCTFGGGSGGTPPTIALAVENGNKFGVLLCNYSTTSGTPKVMGGTVGLGHWPVNGSGTGTVNRWEQSPQYPNGNLIQLAVTNGVTAATTVPAQSVVILHN